MTTMPNNRIKADAGKLGGAARKGHWRGQVTRGVEAT